MSDDNEGVGDSGDDEDDGQDVHRQIVSGMVADLIGDRESHGGQHEMRQHFHAPLGEHEICDNDAYETYDCNKIVDSLHSAGPTVSGRVRLSVEPAPLAPSAEKPKGTHNWRREKGPSPEPDRADLEVPVRLQSKRGPSRSRSSKDADRTPAGARASRSAAIVFTYELVLNIGDAVDAYFPEPAFRPPFGACSKSYAPFRSCIQRQ
jgi:hypothetical protein